MDVAEAFALISRAIDAGRAAHGYLVVGDLKGSAQDLADRVIRKLFPDALDQVANGSHPDVVRLEPQGKSRTIKVQRDKNDDGPGMRDGLIEPMETTAFSGGWKVGVVVGADRMQNAAANAFLKSLEEPPPKTLYLLLTDQPDAILPTIVSRTQRIDLPRADDRLEGDELEAVSTAFAARDADALSAAFASLKADAGDADVPLVRKRFYKTLMGFVRQLMLSGRLPRHLAFRNVDAVEDAYRQSSRSINDDAVLSFLMDRIVFPPAAQAGADDSSNKGTTR